MRTEKPENQISQKVPFYLAKMHIKIGDVKIGDGVYKIK
jgi:hypothetical protein